MVALVSPTMFGKHCTQFTFILATLHPVLTFIENVVLTNATQDFAETVLPIHSACPANTAMDLTSVKTRRVSEISAFRPMNVARDTVPSLAENALLLTHQLVAHRRRYTIFCHCLF